MGNTESPQPNIQNTQETIPITKQKNELPKYYKLEKKIKIGVIGIGQRMNVILSTLINWEVVTIVAISDESNNALALSRRFYGENCKYYLDYKQMIEEVKDIEWILIGSRNCLHYEHCMASFAANLNVFCEKPLAIKVDHLYEMLEAWQKGGKQFITGFVLRHAPIYDKAHKLIAEGFCGKIVSIDANEQLYPYHGGYIMRNWRRFKDQAGPHILEKCCHDIDIMNWLLGSLPTKVAAFGGTDIFKPEHEPKDDDDTFMFSAWDSWENVDAFTSEKDIEDNLACILIYRNGVKVTFNVISCSAWHQRRMRINGIEGTIDLDVATNEMMYKRIMGNNKAMKKENFYGDLHGGGDEVMLQELLEVIITNKPPKVSIKEGCASAVVCLAIEEARVKGQVVDLEETWKKFGF